MTERNNPDRDGWGRVQQFGGRLRSDQAFRRAFEQDAAGTIRAAGLPQPFQANVTYGEAAQRAVPEPQWCFDLGDVIVCVKPWW